MLQLMLADTDRQCVGCEAALEDWTVRPCGEMDTSLVTHSLVITLKRMIGSHSRARSPDSPSDDAPPRQKTATGIPSTNQQSQFRTDQLREEGDEK